MLLCTSGRKPPGGLVVYRLGKLKFEVNMAASFHPVLSCQEPLATADIREYFCFSFFLLDVYENERNPNTF